MTWTPVVNLAAVVAYAAFQWTVRVLVYPQFAMVGPTDFAGYERRHQRLITPLVGVLFTGLGIGAALLFVFPPNGSTRLAGLISGALTLAILAVTGLRAVPLHRRLTDGWDEQAFRALLRTDSIRAALASADLVWAIAVTWRAG